MHIHIIGGGVIGLCSAWYLREAGCEVTVIDRGNFSEGTSHGNSGLIVPSHFTPLAAPGVLSKGFRWMLDAGGPFHIKPKLNRSLLSWLWNFYRAATDAQAQKAMPILLDYNLWSRSLYREFTALEGFDFCFEQKGLLMLFQNEKTAEEEKRTLEKAQQLGLNARYLSGAAVQNIESTKVNASGGIHYPEDAHLHPHRFMVGLHKALREKGVHFISEREVVDLEHAKGLISHLKLSGGEVLPTHRVVLACGSWSEGLAKKMRHKLPVQDGKGYSITMKAPAIRPDIPAILCEPKVAVTPLGDDLRLGGTLELGSMSGKKNLRRIQSILDGFKRFYPEIPTPSVDLKEVWVGYRPCTPDGLPYIGFAHGLSNLCFATGHAMMGMSLGPATGKLVSELLTGQEPSIPLHLFAPNRF